MRRVTTGCIPLASSSTGGRREPIDADHWVPAYIDPKTANTPWGVCTKLTINRMLQPREYGALKVLSEHVEKVWPRATPIGRRVTRTYVWLKKQRHYWEYKIETGQRDWHRIKDNVREEERKTLAERALIEINRPFPDFDRWDNEEILRLFQAACLWCDENPAYPCSASPGRYSKNFATRSIAATYRVICRYMNL